MTFKEQKYLAAFIRQITTAAANISLYDSEHPQVHHLCQQAREEMRLLMNDHSMVTFKIVNNELIFNDQPVPRNMMTDRLIETLTAQQISFLEISSGVSSEEMIRLATTLSKHSRKVEPRKTEHIRFGRVAVRSRQKPPSPQAETAAEIRLHGEDRFYEVQASAGRSKHVDIGGISELVNDFVSAFSTHSSALLALAPLRSMDEYAYIHSTNICLLNLAQARLLGFEGQILNQIGIAAMLHDVGKMFISPDILNKQTKLDPQEWAQMQRHPQLGAEYLLRCPGAPKLAVVNAYEHHIGYNGKGYPQTPDHWQLNTCSYMTTISDVYDALRTRRTYREPLTFAQIKQIMTESSGQLLHPQLTESFLIAIEQMEENAREQLSQPK